MRIIQMCFGTLQRTEFSESLNSQMPHTLYLYAMGPEYTQFQWFKRVNQKVTERLTRVTTKFWNLRKFESTMHTFEIQKQNKMYLHWKPAINRLINIKLHKIPF